MKTLLKLLVMFCRNTPSFRGKWRLEAWLERNRDKYAALGPATFRVLGYQYKVDPKTNFHLYMYGPKKNLKIVPFINRYAKAGTAAIDVGAHNGYFAIHLSEAVGVNGKVYAFEASPVIYSELTQTIDSNHLSNIEATNKAVSDTPGKIDFFVAPTWKSEISSMRSGEGEKLTIDAITLDQAIPETQHVSFVKIDVEGAEMRVLKGMESIIKRDHPVMVIEVTDPWLKELGSSSAEVLEFLRKHGYQVSEIREQECIEVSTPPLRQIDALCIPAPSTID